MASAVVAGVVAANEPVAAEPMPPEALVEDTGLAASAEPATMTIQPR